MNTINAMQLKLMLIERMHILPEEFEQGLFIRGQTVPGQTCLNNTFKIDAKSFDELGYIYCYKVDSIETSSGLSYLKCPEDYVGIRLELLGKSNFSYCLQFDTVADAA